MIRKVGKRWIYECYKCGFSEIQLDLLRVTEAKNRHERSPHHVAKPFADAIRMAGIAMERFAAAFRGGMPR